MPLQMRGRARAYTRSTGLASGFIRICPVVSAPPETMKAMGSVPAAPEQRIIHRPIGFT